MDTAIEVAPAGGGEKYVSVGIDLADGSQSCCAQIVPPIKVATEKELFEFLPAGFAPDLLLYMLFAQVIRWNTLIDEFARKSKGVIYSSLLGACSPQVRC